MYDLGVCWACGGVVFRKEDAVASACVGSIRDASRGYFAT